MIYINAKSSMGFNHLKTNKICQDYSLAYQDKERRIITCCDGHGGDMYIRSQLGSKFASEAILNIFLNLTPKDIRNLELKQYQDKLKLDILLAWNKLIEEHLKLKPIRSKELTKLTPLQAVTLKANPVKAYGTTLTGALLFKDRLIVVGIGDTEAICIKKGEICRVFEDDDEPVANITYSMCQEDAYNHMHVKMVNFKELDGIILCTDGLTSPYQSYDNFNINFVSPMMYRLLANNDMKFIDRFIEDLASRLGVGDDVSLSYIINSKAYRRYYSKGD